MKNSYRILGTSLLTLGLVGCFEVPSRDHLVTAQGIVPNLSCHQPPLVALAAEALPREFGITVWNLYKGQRKNWREGMTAFAQDQDLLLLQESATTPDMLAWLQAGRFQWQQLQAFTQGGVSFGVMTVAKTHQAFVCGVRSPEPLLRIPKSGLVSLYPLQGDPDGVLVVNLHAVNFELGMATFREQLNDLTALIHRHQGPVILGGDFNTWSEKREYWLDKLVEELGLQEAIPSPDLRRRAFGRPLDHLYYRSLDLVEVKSPATDASDHNPIMARFAAQAVTP
ncbi:endonuclease/exonuclease/phosphatase (EEP) superfamily protein YafD [Aeromonas sp. BIGb0405]|jgi:endonuclease/exonuclease/phosphatase (EEP) superfamily protein YafD|uniref:endonuclease/exonuclease/phosphatase family protein n=1 Tax=Aeromonas TaxID=642 RepID=UPI001CC921FD|nr:MULTISPECIES: endonuclease/exonuclease/phosphatase family protein [Aeromonas]MCS3454352.1 endonuclease/exonuclease/phosphatase (EEP) superfamily protein YafD [Aeromonas sp. BIGb0405]UBO75387.1 endonuclease/exonuclease/phosphatase family protein [Aeromonas rivuli]